MRAVRRTFACPICGRTDWCQVATDGKAAICRRVSSDKALPKGGWLHRLQGGATVPAAGSSTLSRPSCLSRHDWKILTRSCTTALSPDRLNFLSRTLGLSDQSLRRLEVGWYSRRKAFTFPMRDPKTMDVVGIRTRLMCPRPGEKNKKAIFGSQGGLFIPQGIQEGQRLYVVEGPTDCAALLDLGGAAAIGRESCNAGAQLVVDLIKAKGFAEIVIVSDRDEPKPRVKGRPELGSWCPGQQGAEALARIVRYQHPLVRVILPPPGIKDMREWKRAGASIEDVEREVLRTPSRKLIIKATLTAEGAGLV